MSKLKNYLEWEPDSLYLLWLTSITVIAAILLVLQVIGAYDGFGPKAPIFVTFPSSIWPAHPVIFMAIILTYCILSFCLFIFGLSFSVSKEPAKRALGKFYSVVSNIMIMSYLLEWSILLVIWISVNLCKLFAWLFIAVFDRIPCAVVRKFTEEKKPEKPNSIGIITEIDKLVK